MNLLKYEKIIFSGVTEWFWWFLYIDLLVHTDEISHAQKAKAKPESIISWKNDKSSDDTVPLWKDNEAETMKALTNSNQILSIVKQEPDGKMELLQQHHKENLARSQEPLKRDNSIRRSTIHATDQRALLYGPSRRKRSPSMTPSNSIFKFRRFKIFLLVYTKTFFSQHVRNKCILSI